MIIERCGGRGDFKQKKATKSGYCFKASMKFRFNSCVTTPPVVLVTWI